MVDLGGEKSGVSFLWVLVYDARGFLSFFFYSLYRWLAVVFKRDNLEICRPYWQYDGRDCNVVILDSYG